MVQSNTLETGFDKTMLTNKKLFILERNLHLTTASVNRLFQEELIK
jgi:hypothetical protein